MGRTGIAGRGMLGRWGANHSTHLVATRLALNFYILVGLANTEDCGNIENTCHERNTYN